MPKNPARQRHVIARRRKLVADFLVMGATYAEAAEAVRVEMGAALLPPKWGEAAAMVDGHRLRVRLDADAQKQIEHIRGVELARLDALTRAVMPSAVGTEGEDDSPGVPPDLNAVDRALKISDRRARLLGLDAPKREEITGKDGAPLALTIRRVNAPPSDD